MQITKTFAALVVLGALCSASLTRAADDFPSRSIRIVVAYSAGGGNDLVARLLAARLSEQFGKTVFVENRAGASGIVGTELVAKSPPDGYTLILSDAPHVINPYVYPSVQYDPVKDFEPVTLVATAPVVLAVYAKAPYQSLGDFIAAAKKDPNKITMGSGGTGTVSHVAGELFQLRAGIKLVHVPYKGNGPAIVDLIGGQISVMLGSISSLYPHATAKKLRLLGVASVKRSPAAPEIPTIAEGGLPGFEVNGWNCLVAPRATPPQVIKRLNAEIVAGFNQSDVVERLRKQSIDPATGTPEQLASYMKSEIARYSKLIKAVGLTTD